MTLLALAALCFSSFQASPLPRKPWFGAALAPTEKGVRIAQVLPGTTAEEAGLKPEDLVTAVGGTETKTPADIGKAMSSLRSGEKAKIAFTRSGMAQTVEAMLKPRPADNGSNYETLYDQVESKGNRIRIFVTRPKASGRHPVLFVIQGIGYVSTESPLSSPSGYGRICKAFADKDWVTVRVDKPGLGDSEGGPADKVDFESETDAFVQALKKTKGYDFVDPEKVVIFGHSMGGCEGPIVASRVPVKGIAVYGTVVRTWAEYMMDSTRSQAALGGASASSIDEAARYMVASLHLLFNEGLSPKEVEAKAGKWTEAVKSLTPDGEHFSGVGMTFWRGCFAQNYASYWEKLDANVLSVYGACDFVAERIDHPMLADIVNGAHPGRAKFVEIPNSDHGFKDVASKKESLEFWGKPGKAFNPAICDVLLKWAEETAASKGR